MRDRGDEFNSPITAATAVALPPAQIVDAGQLLPDSSKDSLITLGADWASRLNVKVNAVAGQVGGFRYQVVR